MPPAEQRYNSICSRLIQRYDRLCLQLNSGTTLYAPGWYSGSAGSVESIFFDVWRTLGRNTLHQPLMMKMETVSETLDINYILTQLIVRGGFIVWSSTLCNFLRPPITSSLLGRNVLSILFSIALNLSSSPTVRDQTGV
jgi:hypothetical protein